MKYYHAYDLRYRQIHAQHIAWFGGEPTPIVGELLSRLHILPPARVLEIGCGEGYDASALMAAGYDVTATDVSPAAIAFCKEKYAARADHFRVLDALADSLDERFDCILAVAVLHMLTEDEDRHRLLTFIRDHLTDAGAGIIVVMGDGETSFATDPEKAFDVQIRTHQFTGREVRIASTTCRVVTGEQLRAEIARAGMKVVEDGPASWDGGDFAMYAVAAR